MSVADFFALGPVKVRRIAFEGTFAIRYGGEEHALEDGSAVVVPAGIRHNLINSLQQQSLEAVHARFTS
jgi:mannose-6-phosphate isomerase-like protein (cupin superfamily)